jgi:2-polyprenyl-3-methyl-5-hydroxy-6-metoxy-1,4-benzoquinol methylase
MNKDYYKKSIHYGFGHTRFNRILALMPKGPNKKILDVGCASGRMGAQLRSKGYEVWGADISGTAIEEARAVLDGVYEFDIQGKWPLEEMSADFDAILFGEVLEHIFDPEMVLKNASKILKSDGVIIITTPNFLTWTNRIKFLFGLFTYQDQGMFDFGHIRWFTYLYLKKVLKNSSLEICEERHIVFPNKLNFLLKYWPGLFAWQFIVKAKKS